MSKIQPMRRLSPEDVPGAPSWFTDTVLPTQNDFNEQVFQKINGGLSTENTVDQLITVDLDHGVQTRVKNPLGKTIPAGIEPVRCIGVQLGSNGQPSRTLYDLATPRIDWKPAATDGQLLVTATYPLTKSEAIGDLLGPINRARSNNLALSTGVAANICTTTKITLTPGTWLVSGGASFKTAAAGTSWTVLQCAISKTSAAMPSSDTRMDPTAAESSAEIDMPATVPGANSDICVPIPSYMATVTANTDLYLVGLAAFTVAGLGVYGFLEAVRMVDAYTIPNPRGRVTLKVSGG